MEFLDSNSSLGALERRKSFSLPSLKFATTENAPLRQIPSSDFIHTSESHSPPTTDSMVTLGEWVAESRREMMQQMDIEEDRPASNASKPFSLCMPFIKRPINPKSRGVPEPQSLKSRFFRAISSAFRRFIQLFSD